MAWIGRDLKYHPIPAPCCGKEHLPVDQVAQSPISLALDTSSLLSGVATGEWAEHELIFGVQAGMCQPVTLGYNHPVLSL